MANDWKIAAIERCEANLREMSAIDGDWSLRRERVADAVNGLAGVMGLARDLHCADPAELAALLALIGEEMRRLNERAMLDEVKRAAA